MRRATFVCCPPPVFWEKATRSACNRSFGPSAADFPRLRGATSLRRAAVARAAVRSDVLAALQRGLPVDADGPEGRLALASRRQLGQLSPAREPVAQEAHGRILRRHQ